MDWLSNLAMALVPRIEGVLGVDGGEEQGGEEPRRMEVEEEEEEEDKRREAGVSDYVDGLV